MCHLSLGPKIRGSDHIRMVGICNCSISSKPNSGKQGKVGSSHAMHSFNTWKSRSFSFLNTVAAKTLSLVLVCPICHAAARCGIIEQPIISNGSRLRKLFIPFSAPRSSPSHRPRILGFSRVSGCNAAAIAAASLEAVSNFAGIARGPAPDLATISPQKD